MGVPPYAAAGRMRGEDLPVLPRVYSFPFEVPEYVEKFVKAGVPIELHLYEGVPHVFHVFVPTSKIARQAFENRMNAMLSI